MNHFMPKGWQRSEVRASRTAQNRRSPDPGRICLEQLEDRALLSSAFASIDGTGNNLAKPLQGSAGTDLIRISPVAYADGVSSPSLPNNPSARVISDKLNSQATSADPTEDLETFDQNSLSDFGYVFGQFIDHDMSLTPTDSTNLLTIPADPNDLYGMGDQTFERSVTDPATGTSRHNPAQQVNAVTSYLDLSQVYGSSPALADALRTHSGGQLKTSPGNMLPYDNLTYFTQAQLSVIHMANDAHAVATPNLFVTGDVRGNENVELTALQTLFVRNHNRMAAALRQEHPAWSDEQLYQEARKLNIAEYQQIIYTGYLPDLLGSNALSKYSGYQSNVSAAISTEFSTVAFRFGHSLLSGEIDRDGNNGLDALPNDPAGTDIDLATDFFDPNVLNPFGVIDPLTGHVSTDIDPFLKGDADGLSQDNDMLAIGEVRNLLFGNSGQTDNGLDLIARDIERARDDGIGTYNQVRVAFGLPAVTNFSQITQDVQLQRQLKAAYGTVDRIDPFEGGLAEDHVPGSDMGPLFTRILTDQFTRLRDGDRFFYLNQSFNSDEKSFLSQGNTLAKVIEANTHITNLQPDVFVFKAAIGGTVSSAGRHHSGSQGLAGIKLLLEDSDGNILATTRTDSQGNYRFSQLNNSSSNSQSGSDISMTGIYKVVVVVPSGMKLVSPDPGFISITRGGMNITDIDFTLGQI